MINFKVGERVMNGTNERDAGTVLEVKPGCDANDHVIVQWDNGENSGCGADCLNSLDRGAWQIKPTADEIEDAAECSHCNGSGEIGCRTRNGSYVGPGPVPDDARGVFAAKCFECRVV